jgi:translation initiation factor IF-3
MAKDLEEQAEIQQPPKREGRNMIMFLTPRKTPLVKKDEKEESTTKAVRTITAPPRPTSAKLAGKSAGNS